MQPKKDRPGPFEDIEISILVLPELLRVWHRMRAGRDDALAEAALMDRDCARLRESPKDYYTVGAPWRELGERLAHVRHFERQIARINERLAALGEKP